VDNEPEETVQTPVKGCKAIIAPYVRNPRIAS
jgi:hypothetical protein